MRKFPLAVGLLLLVGTGLRFAALPAHPFVWDDHPLIVEEGRLRDPSPARFWTGGYYPHPWQQASDGYGRYRPLAGLSYWADFKIWGLRAAGFRWTNHLLHALAAFLLFLLIRQWTGRPRLAAAAAGLFWIHPMQTVLVCYSAARPELLMASALLLLLWVRERRRSGRPLPGGFLWELLLFAAALLFKETGVMWLAVWAADRWVLGRAEEGSRWFRRTLLEGAGWGGVMAGWILLRRSAGGVATAGHWEGVLDRIRAFGQNGSQALISIGAPFEIRFPVLSDPRFPIWVGAVGLILAGALAAGLITGRLGGKERWTRFGGLWGLGAFLPISGLLFAVKPSVHLLYFPFMGAVVMGAGAAGSLRPARPAGRRVLSAAAAVLFALWGWGAIQAGRIWSVPARLYAWTLTMPPSRTAVDGALHLANHRLERGELPEALWAAQRAVELEPDSAEAVTALGTVFQAAGRLEEARSAYQRAVALNPNYPLGYNNLAAVALIRRDWEAVRRFALEALARQPDLWNGQVHLAEALWQTGKFEGALPHYREAVRLRPESADLRLRLARCYGTLDRWEEAIAAHEAALRLAPRDPVAYYNYGVTLVRSGQLEAARACWERTLQLEPGHPDASKSLKKLDELGG